MLESESEGGSERGSAGEDETEGLLKMCEGLERENAVLRREVHLWHLFGSSVAPLWLLCGSSVAPLWHLFGSSVASLWLHFGSRFRSTLEGGSHFRSTLEGDRTTT